MTIGKVLKTKISDYYITAFVFFVGLITFSYIFLQAPSLGELLKGILFFPTLSAALYFWLKALIVDTVRIRKGDELQMPGYVFIAYGLQFGVFLVIQSSIYRPRLFGPNPGEEFLYFKHPILLWLILDFLTSLIFSAFYFLIREAKLDTEGFLIQDILRTTFLLVVYTFVDVSLSLLNFSR